MAKRLDHIVASVHLLCMTAETTKVHLLCTVELLRFSCDECRCDDVQWQRGKRHKGQLPADRKHHVDVAENLEHGNDDLCETLLKGGRNRVHVVRHAAQDLAVGVHVVVAEGQRRQLVVKLPAHVIGRLLGNIRHDVLHDKGEQCTEDIEEQKIEQRLPDRWQGDDATVFPDIGDAPVEVCL